MQRNIKTVAIIGGGPSGCSLATLLKRKGYKVAVFFLEKRPEIIVGVVGNSLDDRCDIMGLGQHDAAEAAVLDETVDPLVAAHQHMGDHVDPQPRRLALADAAVEHIDLSRNFGEQRIERLIEDFKPGHFGIAQLDHDAGSIRGLDASLA